MPGSVTRPPPVAKVSKQGQLSVRSKLPLKIYEGKTLLGPTPLSKALPSLYPFG